MTKIASLVGNLIKIDYVTTNRERMTFARVLVEVPINREYPKLVLFENEIGRVIEQKIVYE